MADILGDIEKSVLKHIDLVGLVESQGPRLVAPLIEPHLHLTADEITLNAKRLRDAAACLENGKLAGAVTDVLQFVGDALD
jgi:hypothetical protein